MRNRLVPCLLLAALGAPVPGHAFTNCSAGAPNVFTVLESNKRLKKFVPSPTGIGIGILVPFLVVFTMFLGGVVGTIWEKINKKSADVYMVPLGSGFIAGEALVAVVAAIYFGVTQG